MTGAPAPGPGRGSTVAGFLLVTGSTLVSGLLNAALIALAARRGEIAEIAAYTVMMAVLAIVGVAVGGGSSMRYLSGTEPQRRAVRSQRVLAVLPSLLVAAGIVLVAYGARGYDVLALGVTALVFVANNLAELPLAQIHRDLRFHRIAVPTVTSKLVSLAVFLPGASMTTALLVGAVCNLVLFELLAGAHGLLRALWHDPPTPAQAHGSFRSGRGLYVYTLAELFATRVPSIGLSLAVAPAVMGSFGAIAAAFQAIMSVFQSGLNMVLSLRARPGPSRRLDTEAMSLGAGVLGAAVILLAAPRLTQGLLVLADPAAATWLRALGAALPVVLLNRIVATHAIADARDSRAARIGLALAGLTTGALAVGIPLAGVLGGTLATLVGEGTVAVALLAALLSRRAGRPRDRGAGRSTRSDRTGPDPARRRG